MKSELDPRFMPPNPTVTLKEIAIRSGRALATVSYALRDDPKIPAATRKAIQETAAALGYRPNPRISSLMAHIRRSQHAPFGETIAFVWVHTSRTLARGDPFLNAVYTGARRRAEHAGFALEDFYTNDQGMTNRRLEQILRARGIVGVVLSPVTTSEATVTLDWDWAGFSPAVIGNVTWTPELHHAGHHHYLGMHTALLALQESGCKRIAGVIDPKTNARAKRAWEAAFLTHHPIPSRARSLLRLPQTPDDLSPLAKWINESAPDALVVSASSLLESPGLRAACQQKGVRLATLYWNADTPSLAGIDQCSDRIAAHAIDLVITQLNANETGVPDLPRMMLFPGRWMPAA